MSQAPELSLASGQTTAEYLAKRVEEAYHNISPHNMGMVESLYTHDAYFEDPSHGVQGRAALVKHFTKTFKKLQGCSFKFHQTVSNGADIFMAWTMFVKYPSLKGGQTIQVEGASFLKTRNGKIYYHRDYFDLGSLLYEHVPFLGRIILKIKQRIAK
jgi:predicted SnoaL-like aldol condensation-catalyzing enzyme